MRAEAVYTICIYGAPWRTCVKNKIDTYLKFGKNKKKNFNAV